MFKEIKTKKVYEQVTSQIQEMIMNNQLKTGDKLPPERELSEMLGVSRTSVREALRALQMLGIIESKQGEGNFIKDSFENNLIQPLAVMFMIRGIDTKEILQTRSILETEIVKMVVENASDLEIEELEDIVIKMKLNKDEIEAIVLDKQFHYKLAKISKNSLILNILNSISSLIDTFIKDARCKIIRNEEDKQVLTQQHVNIVEAIKDRDAESASKYMKIHMDFMNSRM